MAGSFDIDGCARWPAAVSGEMIAEVLSVCPESLAAGTRLALGSPAVAVALAAMLPIAQISRPDSVPVRAILFDKSVYRNWVVPWHQDRTIAVRQQLEAPGFGPWSRKDGVPHVEPPFSLLSNMITLRLHLDPCPFDNAPLEVALQSHRRRVAAARAQAEAGLYERHQCVADAGDIWAYSTPILHRSARAERPTRRRVLQIDFSPDQLPGQLEWH